MIGIDDAIVAVGFFAKAKAFLKRIPAWLYIALAVAALIGTGVWLHSRAVKSAYRAAYAAGVLANEQSHIAAQAKADTRAQQINAQERVKNDEANRRIAADADDLRLRGPGRASCPGAATAPRSAGQHSATAGSADAAVGPLPDPERVDLIALPFAGTIAFAEQCDANRAEAMSWRQADQLQATPSTAGAKK